MPSGIYNRKPHSEETKKKLSEKAKLRGNNGVKGFLGKKLSMEHIEKLRKAKIGHIPWNKGLKGWNSGEKNSQWKGGTTSKYKLLRRTIEYKLWRKSVLERDSYTCIWCMSKEKLHVDHIKPFAYYPELRYAIDNGRTLCEPCHKTTDSYGAKCKKNYEQKL